MQLRVQDNGLSEMQNIKNHGKFLYQPSHFFHLGAKRQAFMDWLDLQCFAITKEVILWSVTLAC